MNPFPIHVPKSSVEGTHLPVAGRARSFRVGPWLLLAAISALLLTSACRPARAASGDTVATVQPKAFWSHWGDGQAELSTYALKTSRYGEMRTGKATAIFVTEDFSVEDRVKADAGRHAQTDVVPVMKLNLVEDFQTGIYDYNLMTSVFSALAPHRGLPDSGMVKVAFSSQEWCGHVYHQLLFDPARIRESSHSYFDGEGDHIGLLPSQRGGLSEDALWLWARGMIGPQLKPGEQKSVPLLLSARTGRLLHQRLTWQDATLAKSKATSVVQVPLGTFTTWRLSITRAAGVTHIDVEADFPHRIVRVQDADGGGAELVGSARKKYWNLHRNQDESALADIGAKAPVR